MAAIAISGVRANSPSRRLEYTVTDLGLHMRPSAINRQGDIAGNLEGAGMACQAMVWFDHRWHPLGNFGGEKTVASAINDRGQVVGFGTTAAPDVHGNLEHGFLYEEGKMTDLSGGKVGFARALAIDAQSRIAGQDPDFGGWFYAAGKLTPMGSLPAVSYRYVNPAAINREGDVVGTASVANAEHGFLFKGSKLVDLGTLGGDFSRAKAISDQGWIVGSAGLKPYGSRHAFLYRNGRMEDLGAPDGFESSDANGINTSGVIVGEASTITGSGFLRVDVDSRAYRYRDGVWSDLNALTDLSGTAIKLLTTASAINDTGEIVGDALCADGWHGFLLTPR